MFAEVCTASSSSSSYSSSSSSSIGTACSFGHQSAFLFVCIGFDAPVFLLLTIIAQSTDAIRMRSVRLLHPHPHPANQALQAHHQQQQQQHLVTTSNAIYLAKGMRGRIDCPLRADPPHTVIVWIKDNRALGEAEMGGRVKVNLQGSLLIRTTVESDQGDYACVAYSPLERKQSSPLVHVLVKDLPYFIATPKPVYQRQPMQLVHMPCIAHGDPLPSIAWQKIDGRFPSTTRTLQDGGNLTIARLTKEDQGLYECIAVNLVASIVTTSLILIEATTPHGPTNVTVRTTDQSATIAWYPAFDGGRPISHSIWHRVYKEDWSANDNLRKRLNETTTTTTWLMRRSSSSSSRDDDGWETFEVIPNDTITLSIHNLIDNTPYQFFVLSNLLWSGQTISSPIVIARTARKLPEVSEWPSTPTSPLTLSNQTNVDGRTVLLPNQSSIGPSHPISVRVKQLSNGLLLTWLPPKTTPVPVAYYAIEYRTVGQWVPLNDLPILNLTYFWPTASRGVKYQFRVTSYGRESHPSKPSEIITFNTGSELGDNATVYNASAVIATVSVLVIVLLCGIAVYIALRTVARIRAARTPHRQPATLRYENVKYCGPNHHPNSPKTMVAKGLLGTRNSLVASVLIDDVVNNARNDHSNDCLQLHAGLCCDHDHETLTNDSSNHREMIQVEATV